MTINKTENLIKKSNEIHNNSYSYLKTVYVNYDKDKVIITCKLHGDFLQRPSDHLRGKGCKVCGIIKGASQKILKASKNFIEKSNKIHKGKYSYNNFRYTKAKEKSYITCNIHGDFLQTPNDHLSGKGCNECGIDNYRSTLEAFIIKANLLHDNKYDYSLTKYPSNNNGHIDVSCQLHGVFTTTPRMHLAGSGCKICKTKNGFTLGSFTKYCKDDKGILYLIELSDKSETFYKIGITSKSIEERFKKGSIPYSYKTLLKIEDDPTLIFNLESTLKSLMYTLKITPKKDFNGKTECFSKVDVDLVNKMYSLIKTT